MLMHLCTFMRTVLKGVCLPSSWMPGRAPMRSSSHWWSIPSIFGFQVYNSDNLMHYLLCLYWFSLSFVGLKRKGKERFKCMLFNSHKWAEQRHLALSQSNYWREIVLEATPWHLIHWGDSIRWKGDLVVFWYKWLNSSIQ